MSTERKRTLHLARPSDAPTLVAPEEIVPIVVTVKRLRHESDDHYEKRRASIHALGPRWVRHPQYVFQPIQSVHRDVWYPAHLLWWESVQAAAAMARAGNPAYQASQRVRNVIRGH